jgi:hypothetical protein
MKPIFTGYLERNGRPSGPAFKRQHSDLSPRTRLCVVGCLCQQSAILPRPPWLSELAGKLSQPPERLSVAYGNNAAAWFATCPGCSSAHWRRPGRPPPCRRARERASCARPSSADHARGFTKSCHCEMEKSADAVVPLHWPDQLGMSKEQWPSRLLDGRPSSASMVQRSRSSETGIDPRLAGPLLYLK